MGSWLRKGWGGGGGASWIRILADNWLRIYPGSPRPHPFPTAGPKENSAVSALFG